MNSSDSTRRAGLPAADDADDANLQDDAFDTPEIPVPEDIEDETGIDLSDASELDADNVPADEEQGRVVQAPD